MLQTAFTAAAASSRRLQPLPLLPLTLLLGCTLVVLHAQYQTHWQLQATLKELQQIKELMQHSRITLNSAASIATDSSSSSSSIHEGNVHLNTSSADFSTPPLPGLQAAEDAETEASGGAVSLGYRPVNPATQQSSLNATGIPPGTLCIDLPELLGLPKFIAGITWDPKNCYTGLALIFPSIPDQTGLRQRLMQDLTAAMAEARNVTPEAINTGAPYWSSLKGVPPMPPKAILSDPAFMRWQVGLMRVLSRYMVTVDQHNPAVPCAGGPASWSSISVRAEDLPLPPCPGRSDKALMQQMGRHAQPFDSINAVVNTVMQFGLCTVPARDGYATHGDFMMARVMNSSWRTFNTRNLEEDAVVFLWDIMYQAREVFLKQRWLGVAAMQSPFDFMAIADIIFEVQPDVIIETGTANGGSALMWAGLLELNGLNTSSVITLDLELPGTPEAFGSDRPQAAAAVMTATGQLLYTPQRRRQTNPLEHPLWAKYVTFVKGDSIDPATVARVKGLLQQKQRQLGLDAGARTADHQTNSSTNNSSSSSRSISSSTTTSASQDGGAGVARPLRVMVLLDGNHGAAHVLTEMEAYCPLVSRGSFCVVEDTKLSRWTDSDAGPLASVKSFLAWHPEFVIDRERELLFTHHPYGYLQRL